MTFARYKNSLPQYVYVLQKQFTSWPLRIIQSVRFMTFTSYRNSSPRDVFSYRKQFASWCFRHIETVRLVTFTSCRSRWPAFSSYRKQFVQWRLLYIQPLYQTYFQTLNRLPPRSTTSTIQTYNHSTPLPHTLICTLLPLKLLTQSLHQSNMSSICRF